MIIGRRQQDHPVAQANPRGALARGGKKDFGRGGMRILLEEVMLDFPHVIDADFVGEFDLVERVLDQFQFRAGTPRTGQLMFVERPKFHRRFLPLPPGGCGLPRRRRIKADPYPGPGQCH